MTEEASSEAALTGADGATAIACTPNDQEPPGGGGGLCNGGGAHVFPNRFCCSGRARFFCPARNEPGESVCIP